MKIDKATEQYMNMEIRKAQKAERLAHANEVLKQVAAHGRRFFYSETHSRTAYLMIDTRGRVWLMDDYSGKFVYTHYPRAWRNFTHGGGLKQFIMALRDYVCHGDRLILENIGQHWGYGDAMEQLRGVLKGSPVFVGDAA